MSRHYSILLALLCVALGCWGSEPKYELRGVWLTTNHRLDWPTENATNAHSRERQKAELREMLDRLQEVNINTVFFQVRARGDVFYASSIEPWSIYLTGEYGKNPGYDPLTFAVDECHKRGMECHAWVVTLPVGEAKQVRRMGSRSVVKKRPQICTQYRGEWYLDPGQPETAGYLRLIVNEIVSNYNIDGIHFDYIRYPEEAQGFPDARTYKKYGGKKSLAEWRTENITRIQETLYNEAKRINPRVLVSVSPLGKYQRLPQYPKIGWTGIESVHQDAGKWMREGMCDFVVPMMYYLHEHFFPFVDDWTTQCGEGFVAPGLGLYRLDYPEWSINDITDQIDYGRFHNTRGNVFFRCMNLLSNREFYRLLKEEYYRYPALMPIEKPVDNTIAPPSALSVRSVGENLVFEWEDRSNLDNPSYLLYRIDGEQPQLIAKSTGNTFLTVDAVEHSDKCQYYLTIYNPRERCESRPSDLAHPSENGGR